MATNKTAHFGWQTPVLEEEADVPADLKRLAEEIEAKVHLLNVEELGNAGAGDAGKLLVVGPGGVNAWKAMSGDATLSSAGAVTIGAEKISTAKLAALAVTEAILAGEAVGTAKLKALAVTAAKLAAECVEESKIKALAVSTAKLANLAVSTAKLAELCVTEAKIADKAVTSRKFKPVVGLVEATGDLSLQTGFQDVPGCELEITPGVTSWLKIAAAVNMQVSATKTSISNAFATIKLDEEIINAVPAMLRSPILTDVSSGVTMQGMACQFWLVALSAVKHTIKLQALKEGTSAKVLASGTRFIYELVGS